VLTRAVGVLKSPAVVSFSVLTLLWQAIAFTVGFEHFPSVSVVVHEFLSISQTLKFWEQVSWTILLSVMGLVFGLATSYIVALAIIQSRFFGYSSQLIINFLRSVPIVVLLPISLAAWGSGVLTVIALSSLAVFTKILFFAENGLRSIPRAIEDMASVSGIGNAAQLLFIRGPASLKSVTTGLQLHSARSYSTVILCGLIIGSPGLGQGLRAARENADFALLLTYGITLAVLGVLIYYLFEALEDFLLKIWKV
jgi:ABC-type nitrate/sulfonate/bicarbonate transport system permease component